MADDPVRQVRQHLESLHAAGVDWLPAAPRPVLQPPAAAAPRQPLDTVPAAAVSPASVPGDLFAAQDFLDPAGPGQLTPEQRQQALKELAGRVAQCVRCNELASTRTQTVFGEGKIDPLLCFLGEAPGADEDATGRPFVGAAGQLLNRIITACGFKREEVYICNILRCRPPGNRQPLPDEAAHCRPFLEQTLDLVRPQYICALGACAAQNLLGTTSSIGRLRGTFHAYRGTPVLCTYHPAYLLRSPDRKKDVWEDLKKLLARMGRPVK